MYRGIACTFLLRLIGHRPDGGDHQPDSRQQRSTLRSGIFCPKDGEHLNTITMESGTKLGHYANVFSVTSPKHRGTSPVLTAGSPPPHRPGPSLHPESSRCAETFLASNPFLSYHLRNCPASRFEEDTIEVDINPTLKSFLKDLPVFRGYFAQKEAYIAQLNGRIAQLKTENANLNIELAISRARQDR